MDLNYLKSLEKKLLFLITYIEIQRITFYNIVKMQETSSLRGKRLHYVNYFGEGPFTAEVFRKRSS